MNIQAALGTWDGCVGGSIIFPISEFSRSGNGGMNDHPSVLARASIPRGMNV